MARGSWSYCSIAVFVCALIAGPASATDVAGGTISTSTTWSTGGSPYVIKGNVTVAGGATLTIDPGVEVRFDGNYWLKIGGASSGQTGKLYAVGTSGSRIVFKANGTPSAGAWAYVHFDTYATSDSTLQYADLLHGGSSLGVVYCNNSSPSLASLAISSTNTAGIYLASSSPSLSGTVSLSSGSSYLLSATSSTSVPTFSSVTLSSSGKLAKLPADSWANLVNSSPTISTSAHDADVVASTLTTSTTWGSISAIAAFHLLGDLTIQASTSPVLTLAAGTTVKIDAGFQILVGGTTSTQLGALSAVGTSSSHVRFEKGAASAWENIYFRNYAVDASCRLEWCDLVDGGSSNGAVFIETASPAIVNVAISGSATNGIHLTGGDPAFGGSLSFSGSSGYWLNATAATAQPTFTGVTLSSSGKLAKAGGDLWANLVNAVPTISSGPHEADVLASTLTKSATWGGLTGISAWHLFGNLTISAASGPVLTIAAGTTVKVDPAIAIYVGGSTSSQLGGLIASGTSSSHVRFEKAGASNWRHVFFDSFAIDTSSRLEWCDLVDVGSTTAALYANSASPTLANIAISNSSTDGIYLASSNASFAGSIGLTGSSGYLIYTTSDASVPTFWNVTLASSGKLAKGGCTFWANLFNAGPTVSNGPHTAEVWGGTLADTSTWGVTNAKTFHVTGSVTISGPTAPVLTLPAGTTMKLTGSLSAVQGGLRALGTSSQHVVLDKLNAGNWNGVVFSDGALDDSCLLQYCDVKNAGASGTTPGAIHAQNAGPTLDRVSVENSATSGLHLWSSFAQMSNVAITGFGATYPGIQFYTDVGSILTGTNTITGSGQDGMRFNSSSPSVSGVTFASLSRYAVLEDTVGSAPTFAQITVASSVAKLGKGGADLWAGFFASTPTLSGTGWEQEVVASTLTKSTTWGGYSAIAAIRLLGNLTIGGARAPVLTLAAGSSVLIESAVYVSVGNTTSGLSGGLRTLGTVSQPVVFDKASSSNWAYVTFQEMASDASSVLEHCTLKNGGSSTGTIYSYRSAPTLTNVKVESSASAGFYLSQSAATITNATIDGFGATSAGIQLMTCDHVVMSGTNLVSGPGKDGISFSASSPTISAITVEDVTGYAFLGVDGASAPTFTSVTVASSAAKVAKGGADLWAGIINASPTISGSGYVQEVLTSTLTRTTTWGATSGIAHIHLLGTLSIGAPTQAVLTLAPGAVVKLAQAANIEIGSVITMPTGGLVAGIGALVSVGTSSNKVTFEAAGSFNWGYIYFTQTTLDALSRLEHSNLENAGYGSWAILVDRCSPRISDVVIDGSGSSGLQVTSGPGESMEIKNLSVLTGTHGIRVLGGDGDIRIVSALVQDISGDAINAANNSLTLMQGCVLDGNARGFYGEAGSAVAMDDCTFSDWTSAGVDSVTGSYPVIFSSTFTGSGYAAKLPASAIDIFSNTSLANTMTLGAGSKIGVYGDSLDRESTWNAVANAVYQVFGDVNYRDPLNIGPGVTIRVDATKRIDASGNAPLPPLRVLGTAASPVVFTSSAASPAAGNWRGMKLGPDSWIEHAIFEYQGYSSTPGIELNGSAILRDCIVRYASGIGVRQTANVTMVKPTVIATSTITGNGSHGIQVDAATRVSLTEVSVTSNGGYGLNLPTATSTTKSFAGLRECTFASNTSGGVSAGAYASADSSYCWWDHASGPAGSGPGSGQSIGGSGTITFNPWFGSSLAGAFRWSEPFVDPLAFVPATGNIHFHAKPTLAATWTLDVTDSTPTTVFTDSGSGTVDVDWDGTDGAIPPLALADGTYDFTLTADDTAHPGTQSILVGTLDIDSTLLVASIQSPAVRSYAAAGTSVAVTGTAAGTNFTSYVLEYGLGSSPATWTQVTSSSSPVTSGSLGSFTAPSSGNQWLSVRLRVNGTGGALASDSILLKLESLARLVASPTTFSPDADEFEDATAVSGGVTWPSDWTVDVFQGTTGPLWSASGSGTQISVTWDGRDTGGTLLAADDYTLRVAASPVDALSVDVTQDLPVTLDGPGHAIHITSPLDGALLTNAVVVSLSSDVDSTIGKHIRLEYGSGATWYVIEEGESLPIPFGTWDTTLAANGTQTLRATMHLENGTVHQDEIDVTLANLRVSPVTPVFDPLASESTQIDIVNDIGLSGSSSLAVEVWAANTTADANWEGRYLGHSGSSPVWNTSVAFTSGTATVTWDGRNGSGAVVPAGEYVVRAEVTYAGGVTATYLEPTIYAAILSSRDITSASVANPGSAGFDPFHGETVDVSFTLMRPAWITLAYDEIRGMTSKLLYPTGSHVFKSDGRRLNEPGLAYGDGPTTYSFYAKATRSPPSLMDVRNSSITLTATSVEPIVVFPTFGQVANVGYTLSRESLVTIRAYQTVSSSAGTFFGTYETDALKSAGAHSFTFEGRSDTGEYPAPSGTYAIEILAKDSTTPSYKATARRLVRLMY